MSSYDFEITWECVIAGLRHVTLSRLEDIDMVLGPEREEQKLLAEFGGFTSKFAMQRYWLTLCSAVRRYLT